MTKKSILDDILSKDKSDLIEKENIIMHKYIIVNFVLTNAIFMPLLFFKI